MKRIKFKWNFWDGAVIVLILAVVVAAYMLSHGGKLDTREEVITRSYTIELNDLHEEMLDCVHVGDRVVDNIRNYNMGTITDMEVVSYTVGVTDEEAGIIRQQPLPDRYCLILTIEADTIETETDVQTVSGYNLKTGLSISCTINELSSGGYILTVER